MKRLDTLLSKIKTLIPTIPEQDPLLKKEEEMSLSHKFSKKMGLKIWRSLSSPNSIHINSTNYHLRLKKDNIDNILLSKGINHPDQLGTPVPEKSNTIEGLSKEIFFLLTNYADTGVFNIELTDKNIFINYLKKDVIHIMGLSEPFEFANVILKELNFKESLTIKHQERMLRWMQTEELLEAKKIETETKKPIPITNFEQWKLVLNEMSVHYFQLDLSDLLLSEEELVKSFNENKQPLDLLKQYQEDNNLKSSGFLGPINADSQDRFFLQLQNQAQEIVSNFAI